MSGETEDSPSLTRAQNAMCTRDLSRNPSVGLKQSCRFYCQMCVFCVRPGLCLQIMSWLSCTSSSYVVDKLSRDCTLFCLFQKMTCSSLLKDFKKSMFVWSCTSMLWDAGDGRLRLYIYTLEVAFACKMLSCHTTSRVVSQCCVLQGKPERAPRSRTPMASTVAAT